VTSNQALGDDHIHISSWTPDEDWYLGSVIYQSDKKLLSMIIQNENAIILRVEYGEVASQLTVEAASITFDTNIVKSDPWDGVVNGSGHITTPGTVGWAITGYGESEFHSVTARGTFQTAASGKRIIIDSSVNEMLIYNSSAKIGRVGTGVLGAAEIAQLRFYQGQVILDDGSLAGAIGANRAWMGINSATGRAFLELYTDEAGNFLTWNVSYGYTLYLSKIKAVAAYDTTLVTNLNADLLDGNHASAFAVTGHDHSGIYSPVGHSHAIADVTGLQDALDDRIAFDQVAEESIQYLDWGANPKTSASHLYYS
jgi:hypothetical protein